jgi:putative DNA primase/helicase
MSSRSSSSVSDVHSDLPFDIGGQILFGGTTTGVYPVDLRASSRWLLWAPEQGRKIPRNPAWGGTTKNGFRGFALCSPKDPRAWSSFEPAQDTAEKLDLHLGYYLALSDWSDWEGENLPGEHTVESLQVDEPHVGLLDLDDIRNSDTGRLAPEARQLIKHCSSTFVEWSPSDKGAHILGNFTLPEDLTSLSVNLASPGWPNATLELYEGGRFTTMTGKHVPGTARRTDDIQSEVDAILARHEDAVDAALDRSSSTGGSPTDTSVEGVPDELTGLEETTDISVIYEIVERTTPADIILESPVTEVRDDGSRSRDPCWADSDSGTRLAEFNDGWMWREGEHVLDALQVVALEEGIISTPQNYPRGSDWWDALDALEARGVSIPELVSE